MSKCPCDVGNKEDIIKVQAMLPHRSDWIIIGISGVTCGGKTTLSNKLLSQLYPAYVFHQDKYFYPDDSKHHVQVDALNHANYDILSSLDMEAMVEDAKKLITGDPKAKAHGLNYHREAGKWQLEGKKFLILEGFTILNYKPLLELCDLRYYFVLTYEECFSRRVYRLYDPPDVEGYFDLCVWPEHLRYKAEIEKDQRIQILDGTQPDPLDLVLEDLAALGVKQIID